jgi:hypothetical protein
MEELHDTFKRIEQETRLNAKFCFFVDGLDEYEGEEKDVTQLLKTLSMSGRIKICASSRPGRQYEAFLQRQSRAFDIAHFTRTDMRRHVTQSLQQSDNWQALVLSNRVLCEKIVEEISVRANGVWLWVSLVTNDIVQEADKHETIESLYEIVAQTPEDLEKYFEVMIGKISKRHRDDMARIFLTVVDEVQPLPLYAFALLEQEKTNSSWVLNSPIEPLEEQKIEIEYYALKDRIRNRCGDLLVVDNAPHPTFLTHSVDFLHRTVRDFLREYNLRMHLKDGSFHALISLSRICLGLLKALPTENFRSVRMVNRVMGLTDELLYYAREAEIRYDMDQYAPMVSILDELDTVNSHHARGINNHWTQARDSPKSRGFDVLREGGKCNFLALAVQARLVRYVRAKLEADPKRMNKSGRPLLDYALRPRRVTPINMPYHHIRDDPSVSVEMVELLLSPGLNADPNQLVRLNGDRSVWALFLLSIRETHNQESNKSSPTHQSLNQAWYAACQQLIRAGARPDCLSSGSPNYTSGEVRKDPEEAASILTRVFGTDRANMLIQEMESQETERVGNSCGIM